MKKVDVAAKPCDQHEYFENACIECMNVKSVSLSKKHFCPSEAIQASSLQCSATAMHAALTHQTSRNDFVLHEELGQGSYSNVRRATHIKTQQQYAMKIVNKFWISKNKKAACVVKEKNALVKLHHPNIISLFQTFQDSENLYFVLELAKVDLWNEVRQRNRMDRSTATFYAAELLIALEYIHKNGIIHRDIKPENLMISNDTHLKLIDFGSCKILDSFPDANENGDSAMLTSKRRESFVGSPEYVCPELLAGEPLSYQSDLWAFGCSIYFMLIGRPPFHGPSEYLTFQQILSRNLIFPADFVDDDARDLIDKLLKHEPLARLGASSLSSGYNDIKEHPFFSSINWSTLHSTAPPKIADAQHPYEFNVDLDQSDPVVDDSGCYVNDDTAFSSSHSSPLLLLNSNFLPEAKISKKFDEYRSINSVWSQFISDGELILLCGLVKKRCGLFMRKRQLVLTNHPRIIYVDSDTMKNKKEIPWSDSLVAELVDNQTFVIHTPKRDYFMRCLNTCAQDWVNQITHLQRNLPAFT